MRIVGCMAGSTFEAFVERKTREAELAVLSPLRTVNDSSHRWPLERIGNTWSRTHYDGDFHLAPAVSSPPVLSLVFVQSRDGNTAADNPDDLGGGPTDKILIYEGLSRVAVDAVLAGARTATGPDVLFSVWHPELVSLRAELELPRHPAQIVVSNSGRLDSDALLFNVPDVRVFLLTGEQGRRACAAMLAERPWITVIPFAPGAPIDAFVQLRAEHRVERISVVGGRATASALLDAGLVHDLCLTTTARSGGEPDTPFYTGRRPPTLDLIVRKQSEGDAPITVEQFMIRA